MIVTNGFSSQLNRLRAQARRLNCEFYARTRSKHTIGSS